MFVGPFCKNFIYTESTTQEDMENKLKSPHYLQFSSLWWGVWWGECMWKGVEC